MHFHRLTTTEVTRGIVQRHHSTSELAQASEETYVAPDSTAGWAIAPTGSITLADHAVHVWRCNIDQMKHTEAQLSNTLSISERRRAETFLSDVARRHFVLGRGLLRSILARYLRTAPDCIRFRYSEHGKPVVDCGAGISPISFNVSHSATVCMYGIAAYGQIGIDVERIVPAVAKHVARHVLSQRELLQLSVTPSNLRERAFFQSWTRKEAYLKAIGTGLSVSPAIIDLGLSENGRRSMSTLEDSEGVMWTLVDLDLGPGYCATLVVSGRPTTVQLWH